MTKMKPILAKSDTCIFTTPRFSQRLEPLIFCATPGIRTERRSRILTTAIGTISLRGHSMFMRHAKIIAAMPKQA